MPSQWLERKPSPHNLQWRISGPCYFLLVPGFLFWTRTASSGVEYTEACEWVACTQGLTTSCRVVLGSWPTLAVWVDVFPQLRMSQ